MTQPTLTGGTAITAEAMHFADLFYRGRFSVPWHQRYFDWTTNDVRSLLLDIDDAINEQRQCYFLGAIMLLEDHNDPKHAEINDGQQRMVTVSLICAAFCRYFLQAVADQKRVALACKVLFDIADGQHCSLDQAHLYTPRIAPPRNDEITYRQLIQGNSIGVQSNLTMAWKEIEEFVVTRSNKEATTYFDYLINNLEIACLWVPPQIDPNAVYETLNCRGKMLEDFDLIRNLIYSYFPSRNSCQSKSKVHQLLETVKIVFPTKLKSSEYFRCRLQSIYGFMRKDNFYKEVRSRIRTQSLTQSHDAGQAASDYVYKLTHRLGAREGLELYRTITATELESDFVDTFDIDAKTGRSTRRLSVILRELRGYKVVQPLTYVMLEHYLRYARHIDYNEASVAKIVHRNLNRLAVFVLRTAFVAPKFEPSHFEEAFSNFAAKISAARSFPDNEFRDFLKSRDRASYNVLDDKTFQKRLRTAPMKGSTKIKHFLLGINREIEPDSHVFNDRNCTVEHIFPQPSGKGTAWPEFEGSDSNDWFHRIGNLTLMYSTDTRPSTSDESTFLSKLEIYSKSSIALTREIAKSIKWTPVEIEHRQVRLIRDASKIWRFR